MPPEDGDNVEAMVTSFLADSSESATDIEPATESEATEETSAEASEETAAEEGDSEAAGTAESEGDEPAAAAEPEKTETPEREPTPLEAAIAKRDPKAFIAALGEAADELMGAKAHITLRHAAKELTSREKSLEKSSKALREKYGDPVEARRSWEAGNLDAFVDAIEKQTGVPWADCRKAVDESVAGRETRLVSKQKAETEAKAAADAKRTEHETALKTLIRDTVKGADAKLLETDEVAAHVVAEVFATMREGWKRGINTPAKAYAAWKKRQVAIAKVLAPAPAAAAPAPRKNGAPPQQIRPPRQVPQTRGAPPKDVEEMVDQFMREEGYAR